MQVRRSRTPVSDCPLSGVRSMQLDQDGGSAEPPGAVVGRSSGGGVRPLAPRSSPTADAAEDPGPSPRPPGERRPPDGVPVGGPGARPGHRPDLGADQPAPQRGGSRTTGPVRRRVPAGRGLARCRCAGRLRRPGRAAPGPRGGGGRPCCVVGRAVAGSRPAAGRRIGPLVGPGRTGGQRSADRPVTPHRCGGIHGRPRLGRRHCALHPNVGHGPVRRGRPPVPDGGAGPGRPAGIRAGRLRPGSAAVGRNARHRPFGRDGGTPCDDPARRGHDRRCTARRTGRCIPRSAGTSRRVGRIAGPTRPRHPWSGHRRRGRRSGRDRQISAARRVGHPSRIPRHVRRARRLRRTRPCPPLPTDARCGQCARSPFR